MQQILELLKDIKVVSVTEIKRKELTLRSIYQHFFELNAQEQNKLDFAYLIGTEEISKKRAVPIIYLMDVMNLETQNGENQTKQIMEAKFRALMN